MILLLSPVWSLAADLDCIHPYRFVPTPPVPLKWSNLAAGLAMLFFLDPTGAAVRPGFGPFFSSLEFGSRSWSSWWEIPQLPRAPRYRWFVPQGVLDWVGWEMIRATIIRWSPPTGSSPILRRPSLADPAVSIFGTYGLGILICCSLCPDPGSDGLVRPEIPAIRQCRSGPRSHTPLAGGHGIVAATWLA